TRSVWGDKGMYLAITPRVSNLIVEEGSAYAVDGVAVGTQYDYLTHIDLRNEHGNFVPWQPTQEDMMACDWEFVEEEAAKSEIKPETSEYNLVFDLTTSQKYTNAYGGDVANGNLVRIEDNIGNDPIFAFYFEKNYNAITVNFSHLNLANDMETLNNIRAKLLTITVDGTKYELGYPIEKTDWPQPIYIPWYKGSDVEKISNLLKQENKKFRFHLNWHD
ncbi:DUF2829 domain-containing protein, partial [Xenorhabdus griffiniae]